MTLTIQDDGSPVTLSRIEEYPNLSERLVGLWRGEDGNEYDFTADGHIIYDSFILNYDVISNNTIMIMEDEEVSYQNIVDLTNDTFKLAPFGDAYMGGLITSSFTRVQP